MIGGAKGIGIGIDLGLVNQYNRTGSQSYIEPEVLDSLVGVWSAYGMTNDSPNRSTIKNKLSNKGGDFVISNAAFKLNSGFGKYEITFQYFPYIENITNVSDSKVVFGIGGQLLIPYSAITENIPSFKIKVNGLSGTYHFRYYYRSSDGVQHSVNMAQDGYYELPICYNVQSSSDGTNCGFANNGNDVVTITQIPSFEGAFVTDGIDDTIISTKTLAEMGITDEVTVVSMIHQISLNPTYNNGFTNYIENLDKSTYVRNNIYKAGKTGIYGYSASLTSGTYSDINNILGDKKDYGTEIVNRQNTLDRTKFSVVGRASSIREVSSIAWYWTIIANKVLTSDQINQVIAYFNLDRTLNPDILCNVKKQRITNENHAEFGDKLIDFSGNGRDIQLNNIAWNKESGIDDDGALRLDGVNDFGKVTGMPVYKDYTVVADYERLKIKIGVDSDSPILSKSESVNLGAFMFNIISINGDKVSYSFGRRNIINADDTIRKIFYQSKYINDGQDINIESTFVDSDKLWLGTYRDSDYRFIAAAIYSLMSFPYSMSEFLIERQLKKHKLGTLYPDMVEFRPIVKSNSEYQVVDCYIDTLPAVVGKYYPINSKLRIAVTTKGAADEVTSLTVNGVSLGTPSVNGNRFTFDGTLSDKSPQKINITIDEYIRFEDIVQPYPVLLRFKDENGNEVSWGGKFRVGSTITRIGSIADPESNLLNGLYSISVLSLNGKAVTSSTSIVEKQMVFKTTATWLLDNNTPKCILSPSRLRIPNSSYKILGYIPDISGHGNHGKINNSAYAEGSGVNEDGSYQFDGVDDFVTIPTTVGGKQMFMKVNSRKSDCYLYDQRNNWTQYLGIVSTKDFIAYNYSNQRGKTYIDGILNENITANDLISITHNITVTNNRDDVEQYFPCIGTSFARNSYAQMSLYDFMLFDEISTDDKIKELNEYVGIEAKVELPPYYWDAYGKTNLDGDKATIQQRGVAVGDYDLINYNHAYEGMSGYNGYPVVFGANKTWEILSSVYSYISDVTSTTIHVTMVKNAGTGLLFSYVKKDEALTNIKEIPAFRVTIKGLEGNSKFGYRYLATEDATKETLVYLGNGTHELAKSFAPTEALLDLTSNAWVGIFITPMVEGEVVFDCDITIEVLPEYENGLVYDGITDYSKNANIPALDDFTAIIKREWLKKQGCPLIKGSKVYEGGNGNALLLEWDKAYNFVFYKRTDIMEGELPDNISFITPTNYNGNVITRGSEQDTNGICIAGDGNAGFANMVFYKLILYPKTIPLLQINFLKNLMERDEIIDLTNPIFIQE